MTVVISPINIHPLSKLIFRGGTDISYVAVRTRPVEPPPPPPHYNLVWFFLESREFRCQLALYKDSNGDQGNIGKEIKDFSNAFLWKYGKELHLSYYIHTSLLPLLHGGFSEAMIKTKVYIYNKN